MCEVITSYSALAQDLSCSPFPADFQLSVHVPTLLSLLMGVTVHRVWLLLVLGLAHQRGFRQWCSDDNMPVNPIFHLQPRVISSEVRVYLPDPRMWGRSCKEKGRYCRRMENPVLVRQSPHFRVGCTWGMHGEAAAGFPWLASSSQSNEKQLKTCLNLTHFLHIFERLSGLCLLSGGKPPYLLCLANKIISRKLLLRRDGCSYARAGFPYSPCVGITGFAPFAGSGVQPASAAMLCPALRTSQPTVVL